MSNYSYSTELVWKIASIEAQNLQHQEIDSTDLMIGILKIVDVELDKISCSKRQDHLDTETEIAILKKLFRDSCVDAVKARRRLRRESGRHYKAPEYKNNVIHRSSRVKDIFRNAEKHLNKDEKVVRPVHLLASLLENQEPELERLLLLINFPSRSVQKVLQLQSTSKSVEDYSASTSFVDSELGDWVCYCRTAIGYLELSMISDAKKELQKIPIEHQDHPLVKKLLEQVAN